MIGWGLFALSAVSMDAAAVPPVQLAQADITTPAYTAPAVDPWYGYKLRLAALARQQGVREATIRANVSALNRQRAGDRARADRADRADQRRRGRGARALSALARHRAR